MTLAQIITLHRAFGELSAVSAKLSAKAKWNLAMNLKRAADVAEAFEGHRVAIFRTHAPECVTELKPGDTGWDGYKADVEALLAVESETTLLRFQFSDLVRDDLEIDSRLLLALEPLMDGVPDDSSPA